MRITDGGAIDIKAKSSLVSAMSTVTLSGRIKKADDGYKVSIDYSLDPSTACWIITVVLFCVTMIGALVILVPLFEKSTVTRLVENALRDLQDATEKK